jgi:integrase
MRAHLTEIAVRALKPVAGKQFKVWDSSTPGFGVLVNERSKSWIVMRGRERTLKVIGRFPSKSLSDARLEAKKILVTPEDSSQPPSPSFLETRDQFLEKHGATLRPRSLYQIKRTLNLYFKWPKAIDEITHSDVVSALDGIKKPSERAHAMKDIKTFFTWCVPRHIPHSRCAGIRKVEQKDRERVLTDSELVAVWKAAEASEYPFGPIVRLLITTGQRRGEIGGLRRSWNDPDARIIKFPSDITKNGREHFLPYGEVTAKILSGLPEVGDLFFPARGKPQNAFSGYSPSKKHLDKLIKGDNEKSPVTPWTIHDLRRTASTQWAEIDIPQHINDRLLNHVTGGNQSRVARIYNRYEYLAEKREAINLWEKHLAEITAKSG